MKDVEITILTSKGRVVLPRNIRKKLNLQQGDKFVVIGEGNSIVLEKIKLPDLKDLEPLLNKGKEFTKNKSLEDFDKNQ